VRRGTGKNVAALSVEEEVYEILPLTNV